MPGLIDAALEDFPRSEIWRIQTDGWQAVKGPLNFRPQFYKGMHAAFQYLSRHDREKITPGLLEDIYHSFYSHEDAYKSDDIVREGYNTYMGEFEIFLPEPGLESQAGVSEEGLSELIEALKTSAHTKGSRKQPFMEIKIDRYNQYPIYLNALSDNFEEDFRSYLMKASVAKTAYTGNKPKPSDKDLVKVFIVSSAAEREEIIELVQSDIDNYYHELEEAQKIPGKTERMQAEINAINHFIRKLHQSHYFPDGNGRTFVFLLANMLLLQNGYGMKIVEYPAHFAGFSTDELAQETLSGLTDFQAYKVTRAKNYLALLSTQQINDPKNDIKEELLKTLSAQPLIAMTQINELFLQIKEQRLHVPKGYNPSLNNFLSLFGGDSKGKKANMLILALLKDIYLEQLNRLIEQAPEQPPSKQIGFEAKEGAAKTLMDMLDKQEIVSDCDKTTIRRGVEAYQDAVTGNSKEEILISTA
ncbi:hypothetical protein GH742_08030 [Legionella sp. MW5194]|uniref:Fic family protein n=1 Tax=Legionella sp. MW5194 TaxID=2662448 RepID=UPI00193DF804|nr:Fic family protein [Legionella sp. MW5194]QRN03826.1 hypothetical protein GH742_08030 [Legionella sp. MW5194]